MDMHKTILAEIGKIEQQYHVRVLHAVESGSRAWGFASPDSDYDIRFVYVRPAADYLRLDTPRDVIEWKLDEVLDINGWDLQKALRQFARGNATLFEWSESPVVYKTTDDWKHVRETAKNYFSEKAAIHHYYGTAMKTWSEYLQGDTVRYKKYFYALRPLLAAQYIERFHTVPPVLFKDLLKMEMDPTLKEAIDDLVEKKKVTTEGEQNPQIPVIQAFIQDELRKQKTISDALPDDRNNNWTTINNCFVEMIGVTIR